MGIRYYKSDVKYTIGSFNKKPLDWVVIADYYDDRGSLNGQLVVAEKPLLFKPFHDINEYATWNNSTLRTWLNRELFASFSDEDKERIILKEQKIITTLYNGLTHTDESKDYIFILSPDEIMTCVGEGVLLAGSFWLRTGGTPNHEAFCFDKGTYKTVNINSTDISVLPAMWIKRV